MRILSQKNREFRGGGSLHKATEIIPRARSDQHRQSVAKSIRHVDYYAMFVSMDRCGISRVQFYKQCPHRC